MKKQKENKEKKVKTGPRFRALDAVIILLILAAVIGVYLRYNHLDIFTGNQNQSNYIVSFSIKDIRYTTPEYYVSVDDIVYFSDDGKEMGTLIGASDGLNRALSYQPATKQFVTEDGLVEEIQYPNNESRVDANGRMRCLGSYTEDGGFLVNGSRYLSAGQSIAVQTERVTVTILIEDITAEE